MTDIAERARFLTRKMNEVYDRQSRAMTMDEWVQYARQLDLLQAQLDSITIRVAA
jgi:hypothetical protein